MSAVTAGSRRKLRPLLDVTPARPEAKGYERSEWRNRRRADFCGRCLRPLGEQDMIVRSWTRVSCSDCVRVADLNTWGWPPHVPSDYYMCGACGACGRAVCLQGGRRPVTLFCSERCAGRIYRMHRRRPIACGQCGMAATRRSDARYCSDACRQRAYRRRKETTHE
ncbi:hypothetical protein BH24CHL8_BH24CHL8_11760 [soil metagenome]